MNYSIRIPRVGLLLLSLLPLLLVARLLPLYAEPAAPTANELILDQDGIGLNTNSEPTQQTAWGDVDNDGDLDLAVANDSAAFLYLNTGSGFSVAPVWQSANSQTYAVAWGDIDNDDDLDLAVDNHVYRNENGQLSAMPVWSVPGNNLALNAVWGDVDGDADLDLFLVTGEDISLYQNDGGVLSIAAAQVLSGFIGLERIALGDVDNDGDLDLATAHHRSGLGTHNYLYLNESGVFSEHPDWQSADTDDSFDVEWGDVDNDGDLDLAVGNWGVNRIYYNENGMLESSASWNSRDSDNTSSVAWGDANGDGWLDLAFGNYTDESNNKVHLNFFGLLDIDPNWIADDQEVTQSITWGDVDGDSDLDLLAGNLRINRLYPNETLGLPTTIRNLGTGSATVNAVAFGDIDNDGDLDIAYTGVTRPAVLENVGGDFATTPLWTATDVNGGSDIAWGDVDGDGDLDLAVGGSNIRLYFNNGGILEETAGHVAVEVSTFPSLAWADVDGDGDLDLAAGNKWAANQLFLNQNGSLDSTAAWHSAEEDETTSIAWGDMDNDGDLDLAVGNDGFQANKIYRNDGGVLTESAVWESAETELTQHIAWGDVNGDGHLDLAVGNTLGVNRLHMNIDGQLETNASWASAETNGTQCVAWHDVDHDGDLDLAVANSDVSGQKNRIYLNDGTMLAAVAAWESANADNSSCLAWGDINNDGLADLVVANSQQPLRLHTNQRAALLPNRMTTGAHIALQSEPTATFAGSSSVLASADFYAQPAIREGIIPIRYHLFEPNGQPSGAVRLLFSLNGGANWRVAVPTSNTVTTGLAQLPHPTIAPTNTHAFYWDTFASGLFGQSDNVIVRLEVFPNGSPASGTPFPIMRPATVAYSYPFRVRGTQVRVLTEDGTPVQNALVYQQSGSSSLFAPMGAGDSAFRTNQNGFLQGGGELKTGDRLIALLPVTTTLKHTLYETSAAATVSGLESYEMVRSGVQTLTISAENPLLVFNLSLSLEWDARNNPTYLNELRQQIEATSRILFDLSNGQIALGKITVYQEREAWHTSDVRVFASNTIRPNADVGGVVSLPVTETIRSGTTITQAYIPGQVRMPATWNRYGTPAGNPGEDWARAFAHELAHYLLFQLDNYLGRSDTGNLALTDCVGSVMTQAYALSYSEFVHRDQWIGECLDTLAEHTTGRTDWETITHFYPALDPTRSNSGPANLPLQLLTIDFVESEEPGNTLVNAFVEVRDQSGAPVASSSGQMQVYLYKTEGTENLLDDSVLPLGSPVVGDVLVRGVETGDRLCVYEQAQPENRYGCIETFDAGTDTLIVEPMGGWNPQISVIPPISNTLLVTVTQEGADNLMMQVYPSTLFTNTLVPTALTATLRAVVGQEGVFSQTITLDDPTFSGFVRVWEPATGRESLVSYYFGGGWGPTYFGWGPTYFGWGPTYFGWGPTYFGWGTNRIGWGIGRTGWNAPVNSASGQVTVFDMDNVLGPTPPYILQSLTEAPDLPPWLTPVGQAYRFVSPIPFTGTHSILFNYFQRDVPNETLEAELQIYHQPPQSAEWNPLPTETDYLQNLAVTRMPDEGVFVLATTFKAAELDAGPNNVAYPLVTARPVTEAVASIEDQLRSVYRQTENGAWELYDPNVLEPFQPLVNTLHTMTLDAYWINATEAVTWYLPVDTAPVRRSQPSVAPPPMTLYGWITPTAEVNIQPGDWVQATIDGVECGSATVLAIDERIGYVVSVAAEVWFGTPNGCGTPDKMVQLVWDGQPIGHMIRWDNQAATLYSPNLSMPTAITSAQTTTAGKTFLLVVGVFLSLLIALSMRQRVIHVWKRRFSP